MSSLSFRYHLLPSASLPKMVSGYGMEEESYENYMTPKCKYKKVSSPLSHPGDTVCLSGTYSLFVLGITHSLIFSLPCFPSGCDQWSPFNLSCGIATLCHRVPFRPVCHRTSTPRKLRKVRLVQNQGFYLPDHTALSY